MSEKTFCGRCGSRERVFIVVIFILTAGCISLIYYSYSLNIEKKKNLEEKNTYQVAEALLQQQINYIPLRIELDEDGCHSNPVCLNHTLQIKRTTTNHQQPMDCQNDLNVKNSSCYTCRGGSCITFEELSDGNCSRTHCCSKAQMGNVGDHCGEHGVYACTSHGGQPTCHCQDGYMGDQCKDENTHKVQCTCYRTDKIKFSKEEEYVKCDEIIPQNTAYCHMWVNINNNKYNCLCNTSR